MSTYLKRAGEFEAAINRGILSHRSPQLKELIDDIDLYVRVPDRGYLANVAHSFDEWRLRNPKEFGNRSENVLEQFVQELQGACNKQGVPFGQEEPSQADDEFSKPPAVVKNVHRDRPYWGPGESEIWAQGVDRHPQLAKAGVRGMQAANAGITVGQAAVGQAGLTGVLVGGAVTTATGVGLIAGSAVLALVQMGLALRSAQSTHVHMVGLSRLYHQRKEPFLTQTCDGAAPAQQRVHELLADRVLPYIYWQKHLKVGRKLAVGTLPVLGGLAVSGVTVTRNVVSRLRGTLGVERFKAAHWLAAHFCDCHCLFTDLMVAFLYGTEDMKRLHRSYSYEETAELLALKMKSI